MINFDFNATFRVEPTGNGQRFALRLNVNSRRDRRAVTTEATWVSALAEVPGIMVPLPQATPEGELAVDVRCDGLDRPIPCVLYTWLDGPDLGSSASRRRVREIGRLAARLHDHAESWAQPPSISFKSIDDVMLGEPDNLSSLDSPSFDPSDTSVILEALASVQRAVDGVFRRGSPHPIHADLHLWNTKWVDDHLAVFDFDDAGLGRPIQDLAISAFYLRDDPQSERALLDGYAAERPVPEHSPAEWEALIAGRNLLLLNDLVASVTAGSHDFVARYFGRTAVRMRHYLRHQRFRLDLE